MNSGPECSTNYKYESADVLAANDTFAAPPKKRIASQNGRKKGSVVNRVMRGLEEESLASQDSEATWVRGNNNTCRQKMITEAALKKKKGKGRDNQKRSSNKPNRRELRNAPRSPQNRELHDSQPRLSNPQKRSKSTGRPRRKPKAMESIAEDATVHHSANQDTEQKALPSPSTTPAKRHSTISSKAASAQVTKLAAKLSSERIRNGQCPTCGIQLYKIRIKGVFRRSMERKPITLEGQVKKGKCLMCSNKGEENAAAIVVNAMSSMIDDFDENKKTSGRDSASAEGQERRKKPFQSGNLTNTRSSPPMSDGQEEDEEDLVSFYSNAKDNEYSTRALVLEDPRRMSLEEFACVPDSHVGATYNGGYDEHGARDGEGKLIWPNGDQYKGGFYYNARHGHGSLFFSDGGEYVGTWKDDKMHGAGTRRYRNGDVYTGEYVLGLREGKGQYFYQDGSLYAGSFYEDSIHGVGRYYYKDGQSFEGFFAFGKREGKGKFQFENGEIDVQRFADDQRVGEGVRWSADRTQTLRLCDNSVRGEVTQIEAAQIVAKCDCNLWETMDD